jgi:predicted GNAT family N-acyltransferase
MASGRIVREQLASHHDLSYFNSGEAGIDSWLRNSALRASYRDYSRTYVWNYGNEKVVAFFCLSAYSITLGELPKKQARGEQDVIPAFLLGKFALDISLQGKDLSRLLIADAIYEANRASKVAAARYLVVDALTPGLVDLYEKFGFKRPYGPTGEKTRLYALIKDLIRM